MRAPTATSPSEVNSWPEIDLTAETLRLKERDLGRLELNAQPRGADWRIDSLKLINEDGRLDANGWWRGGGGNEQTTLDADLDVHDAGKYLARYALPDAVRDAPTRIRGQVSWTGGPQDFDYPTLNGKLRLETGRGQFTKLDPGLGKLLGVLSLQSLKRRLDVRFPGPVRRGLRLRRNHRRRAHPERRDEKRQSEDRRAVGARGDPGRGRHRARDAASVRARAADACRRACRSAPRRCCSPIRSSAPPCMRVRCSRKRRCRIRSSRCFRSAMR